MMGGMADFESTEQTCSEMESEPLLEPHAEYDDSNTYMMNPLCDLASSNKVGKQTLASDDDDDDMSEHAAPNKHLVRENRVPISNHKSLSRRRWWSLGGQDHSFVSVEVGYARNNQYASSSETTESVERKEHNVFDTAEATEFYKPIEGYEGSHRFSPSAKWTVAEEQALISTVRLSLLIDTTKIALLTIFSWTGGLLCHVVSCSLLYSSIEETTHKPSRTICWVSFPRVRLQTNSQPS